MPTTKSATKAAPKKKTASVLINTSTGKFASKASEKSNPGGTVRIKTDQVTELRRKVLSVSRAKVAVDFWTKKIAVAQNSLNYALEGQRTSLANLETALR